MSQPDTMVQWDHYERYTSAYGSVTRENNESEWIARVNLKGGRQGKIKETFTNANVAMAALVRTWKRENGPIVERPVVAKLVRTRTFDNRIRLIAETIAPENAKGQPLEIIVKSGDTEIQALYEILRQAQTDNAIESGRKKGKA